MRIEAFLEQSPVFQISQLSRQMTAALNSIFAREGLTGFEAMVLTAIFFEKKGVVQPSDLARTFETTRGNVSHCLSSLEAKGLVERKIDFNDARALRIHLRPVGRRMAARAAGILDRMQRIFEEGIGATVLKQMLEQVRAAEVVCTRMSEGQEQLSDLSGATTKTPV